MKQSVTTQQSTRQTPQQFQISTLIQASNEELEQLIRQEVEGNFTLEMDENEGGVSCPDEDFDGEGEADDINAESENTNREYDTEGEDSYSSSYVDDDYEPSAPVSTDNEGYGKTLDYRSVDSFRTELLSQLDVIDMTEEEDFLARYLVESLDDKGYLSKSLADLVDELDFLQNRVVSEAELERVLVEIVQGLDPIGVGARDLRECLLLQLQEMKSTPETQLAYCVVEHYFEDLAGRRTEKICQRLECTQAALSRAFRIITHLSPNPAGVNSEANLVEDRMTHIKADFEIRVEDGDLKIALKDQYLPTVHISCEANEMAVRLQNKPTKTADEKAGLAMLKENMSSGNMFISSLRQRHETLSNVIRVIADMQRDYFLSSCNPEMLKPMVLQDVADRSGYDVSTISRVSNSKYIATDTETIAVKDLFTSGIQTEQGVVSNTAVMDCLREIIEQEDKNKPLNDDALSKALLEKGFKIARRTVSKYRELLKYPPAKERRSI